MLQTANPHRWPISEALTPKRGVRAAVDIEASIKTGACVFTA
jgi:hypothetical protein